MREEIHGGIDECMRAEGWRQGDAVFGRLAVASAPDMDRATAERLTRDILASLADSSVTTLDDHVMSVQQEGMRQADRFDAIMLATAPESRPASVWKALASVAEHPDFHSCVSTQEGASASYAPGAPWVRHRAPAAAVGVEAGVVCGASLRTQNRWTAHG